VVNKNNLLEAIYKKTGIYITNKSDCRRVSQLILDDKMGFLSESTLYRFFLHDGASNKPYLNTYNTLAKFCGYADWHSFLLYENSNHLFNDAVFVNKAVDVVLEKFVTHQKFNSLIDVYDTLATENYKTREYYGVKTFLNFQKTSYFPDFVKQYGQHPFVRNILIEALYDPLHRMHGYAESIEHYIHAADQNSKEYLQDLVFAHAVLFRYYFLIKHDKALFYGNMLYEDSSWEKALSSMHIFPKTRYLAYKFWYIHLKNNTQEQQNKYGAFVIDWFNNELKTTFSIIDINIMYQTLHEVLENLNLTTLKSSLDLLFENKIKLLKPGGDLKSKLPNANGILNLLPQ
jgi:hypothetical protein